MEAKYESVTYDALKNLYTKYTWDSSIGSLGGFRYIDYSNNPTEKSIKKEQIGAITKCDPNKNLSPKSKCLGISKTTTELDSVPIGSDYGWSDSDDCWYYFTDESSENPTFYSNYITE